MNPHTIKRLFPRASASLIAANAHDYAPNNNPNDTGKNAELERNPGDAPLAESEGEKANTGRVLVSIVSVRKRLLDPDNIAAKWHIDCLRFSGIIREDTAEEIELQISQRKAAKGEEEHTLITITYPDIQPEPKI